MDFQYMGKSDWFYWMAKFFNYNGGIVASIAIRNGINLQSLQFHNGFQRLYSYICDCVNNRWVLYYAIVRAALF